MHPLSFAAICHRLGITHRSRAWQAKHVRFLIKDHEFPEPLPSRAWRVGSMSWDARAVDHWFDERAGRSAIETAEQEAIRQAAVTLDARAAAIGGAA